jgi:tetratricopeptide (TPR) repeat protein
VAKSTDRVSGSNSARPGAVPALSFDDRLSAAIRKHNEGVAGSKEAVQRAQALFKSLHEQYPDNAAVKAYYGSTLALMARDANRPSDRLGLAKQGLALLDEAVAAEPEERSLRMLRGKIAHRLPEQFFHRADTAIEDYAMLIGHELENPGSLEQTTYAQLVYELGEAYYRTNRLKEAKLCWSMLPKLTNDGKLINQSRAKNKTVSRKLSSPANEKFELRDLAGVIIGIAGASLLRFTKRK